MYGYWVREQIVSIYRSEEPLRTIAVRFFTSGEHSQAVALSGNEVSVDGKRIFHPRFAGILQAIDAGDFENASARLNDAGCTLGLFKTWSSL